MDHRLIAADIDGTLLNSKGELTERTLRAVRAAIDKGVYFVLSTGRPLQGIAKLVERLGLNDMPYILYNGAMVVMEGETIYSLTLSPSDARLIAEEGHKRNSTMICWSANALYSEFIDEKVIFYKSITGVEPIVLSSLADIADNGITKFVWYDGVEATKSNYRELGALYGDRINIAPSRVDFLEFVNKNCSKATAMQKILERLSIKREESVAIGDGFNDLPMLEYAGLGVAMGNADEKVKARCGYVTDTCDCDGLAKFLEEYVL